MAATSPVQQGLLGPGGLAVARQPDGSSDRTGGAGWGGLLHSKVASEAPGSVVSKLCPFSLTEKLCGLSFSLCATRTVDPSGLTKATSMIWPFQPVVPNDVLAMRTAPGFTKRLRWPSA